ncbi:ferredoxin [Desulfobaculum sp.]
MSEKKEISINRVDCTACMGCVEMCPDLFEWDDLNEEVVLRKDCATEAEMAEAIALCPQDCIEVHGPCQSGDS